MYEKIEKVLDMILLVPRKDMVRRIQVKWEDGQQKLSEEQWIKETENETQKYDLEENSESDYEGAGDHYFAMTLKNT
jgi:hypothetical protein